MTHLNLILHGLIEQDRVAYVLMTAPARMLSEQMRAQAAPSN